MQVLTIQYLRALAAFGVLCWHIHLWEQKNVGEAAVTPGWFSLGDFGVDLFFVISGMIMIYITPRPLNSFAKYAHFLGHRFSRIYPPYWIVFAALFCVWLLKPTLFNNYYDNQVDIVRSFFLLPQNYTPLVAVGWTLIHEVYFYLVISLVLIAKSSLRPILLSAWFIIVLSVFLFWGEGKFGNNRFLQLIFSPFSLTFLLGCFIGLLATSIRKIPPLLLVTIFIAGWAGLAIGHANMPSVGVYPDNNLLPRFIGYGIPSFLLVLSSLGIDAFLTRKYRTISFLGDASYSTYLTHLPVIAAFWVIAAILKLSGWWMVILCFLLCMIVASLFHILIEKRIIRLSRRLLDETFQERK